MPINTGYRGSTQDNSGGVIVAQAVNEVTSANTLVVGVQEGNISTYNEFGRTSISVPDNPVSGDMSTVGFAGLSGVNLFDKGNALNVAIRAICSLPSISLSGRLIFYDGSNNALGFSSYLPFTSDSTLRMTANSGYLSQVQLIDANQSRKAAFKVDGFGTGAGSGTWQIYCRPV